MEEAAPDVRVRRAMALRRAARAHYRRTGSLAGMNLHAPVRPGWTCAGCGGHWPCHTRRSQLLAEFDGAPASLTLLMGGHFIDAAQDLRTEPAHLLYERFMGWLRQQPRPDDDQEP